MGIVIMALVFPSPYGDYGSYLSADVIKATIYTANFRPLTGIMVLIKFFLSMFFEKGGYNFRPLTGIMVLIRTLYRWLYEAFEMAFCGADHIFSSFFVFCKKMIFKKLLKTEF